jgi:hypothetical protein
VDYIIDLAKIEQPTATQAPISLTLESIEASRRIWSFAARIELYIVFAVKCMVRYIGTSTYFTEYNRSSLYVPVCASRSTLPIMKNLPK